MVSPEAPLISNLSVLENCALILMFRRRMKKKAANETVMTGLEALGLAGLADRRNPDLTDEERFAVLVLRAVMVENNAVAIDRPFQIVPDSADASFIRRTLSLLKDRLHECVVFDYTWNRERYGEVV